MKRFTLLLTALIMVLCFSAGKAFAEHYPETPTDWKVTFDGGDSLKTNYTDQEISNILKNMQPNDSATLEFTLVNDYDKPVAWWMSNEVMKSLEENSVASDGAYTYELMYYPSDGSDPVSIYYSNVVGGTDSQDGLKEATEALNEDNLDEKCFFLEEIAAHGTARVTIRIKLDGEAEANSYQNTDAQLGIRFVVELLKTEPREEHRKKVVYTGDPNDLRPYYLTATASFLVMVAGGLYLYKTRKEEEAYENH